VTAVAVELPVARSWRDAAACRGRLDVWYSAEPFEQQVAVAVCRRCPVRTACLAEAFAEERPGFVFGVRGGLTAAQRAARQGRAS
jgi:WhiB family transcriptional regulator, redox-sensing transcriptional regulator